MAEYEYLCHVGEALQWIEGCLDEETGFGVTEMGDGLADGVVLAKLARAFQGADVVKKIEVVSPSAGSVSSRLEQQTPMAANGKHRYLFAVPQSRRYAHGETNACFVTAKLTPDIHV